MAVTSLWPVTARLDHVIRYIRNPDKVSENAAALHQIGNVVQYAADQLKTEERKYVTGINCNETDVIEQFWHTKRVWRKTGGRLCFHGYQSFREGEVDAETAHEIGVELARRLWGDRFEVLVATHCNTGHYHNHLVINSVSLMDGGKLANTKADYRRMREESDRLCREYGLSVIAPKGRGESYAEWTAEQEGKPTIRSMIRADIDAAISLSITWRDFEKALSERGYSLKLFTESGAPLKHPGIKPEGAKGYFRLHKLGRAYELDNLKNRILRNYFTEDYTPRPKRRVRFKGNYRNRRKVSGLRAMYYHYCYRLHIYQRHSPTKRVSFAMRQDVTRLEQLDAQLQFLVRNHIDTQEQLNQRREDAKEQIFALYQDRNSKRAAMKSAKRKGDEARAEELKTEITQISQQLKSLRKEVKLCDAIESHSAQVRQNLSKEVTEHEQRRDGRSGRENDPERN